MFLKDVYKGSVKFTNVPLMMRTAKTLLRQGNQINICPVGTTTGVFVLLPKDHYLEIETLIKRLNERIFK